MAARSISRGCLHICAGTTATSTLLTRSFVQIASRQTLHTAPLLDFLAPSISPRAFQCPRVVSRGARKRLVLRYFSSSAARRQTEVIYNPRKGDDGADMTVEITPRAANRLKEIMIKDSNPNLALRITVESGGCHGFQYLMSLTNLPARFPASPETISETLDGQVVAISEDDTVFQSADGNDAKVVMDGPSLELLKGSKIDYTMELIGSQFKIVDNPLATSSCGCGTSFDIKA